MEQSKAPVCQRGSAGYVSRLFDVVSDTSWAGTMQMLAEAVGLLSESWTEAESGGSGVAADGAG